MSRELIEKLVTLIAVGEFHNCYKVEHDDLIAEARAALAAPEGLAKDVTSETVVIVAANADADEMNALHGEHYGVDWVYRLN